jgi:acyl-CoA reductase-like NAD-dependent aldehyde dehydrogenase
MSNIPHFPLKIAGLSKPGAPKAEVYSPYNDRVIGTVDKAGEAEVEMALETASQLFRDRSRWLTTVERIAILEKAVAMMMKNRPAAWPPAQRKKVANRLSTPMWKWRAASTVCAHALMASETKPRTPSRWASTRRHSTG